MYDLLKRNVVLLGTFFVLAVVLFSCSTPDINDTGDIDVSWADTAKVSYYSKIIEKQIEIVQTAIIDDSEVPNNIVLANDFLDWLGYQNVVNNEDLPQIPPSVGAVTYKDAEAVFYGVVDGYYPTSHIAYNEANRRVAYRANVNILDPGKAWLDTLKFMINEGYWDIFPRVNLAQTERISEAFFLEDKTYIIFGLAHEAITKNNHSLYCIDEPAGMIIPVYLVLQYCDERISQWGSNSQWADIKTKISTYIEGYRKQANSFNSLYDQLNKNSGDYNTISSYFMNNYINVYWDIDTGNYSLSFKLFMTSLDPAKDNKLGWSYIISAWPYYGTLIDVFQAVEQAMVYHSDNILRVCRNFTSMSTPESDAYQWTDANVVTALEEFRQALLK